jgi:hypothetical protein
MRAEAGAEPTTSLAYFGSLVAGSWLAAGAGATLLDVVLKSSLSLLSFFWHRAYIIKHIIN